MANQNAVNTISSTALSMANQNAVNTRSSTALSMANQNAVNTRSSTALSMANQNAVNTRSSTALSMANQNAVNTRSSTALSMANQNAANIRSSTSQSMSRGKSSVSMIFQEENEKARKSPLRKRKENQVRLEIPPSIIFKTSPLNAENSEEIDEVKKCNDYKLFVGHRGKGMLQHFNEVSTRSKGTPDNPRPKTSLGHPTVNVRIKTRRGQGQGHNVGEGRSSSTDPRMGHRKSTLPGFFEETDEKPTLLQLHKERVKSANYIARIDTVVGEFKDWKMDEKNIINDYYYNGQVGMNRLKNSAGAGVVGATGKGKRRISMKPAETKIYTGDR